MPGIYIHIPFCKQACTYCDFHFSTSLKNKEAFIAVLLHEIELRKDYLENKQVDTVYFGGGTPSILLIEELDSILTSIKKFHPVNPLAEITLEANPDDISASRLQEWKSIGINRLSIGVQSFFNEDLQFMKRAHNASQARQCIELAKEAGFENITIDLIYGSHTLTHDHWKQNLLTAFELNVPHISCYMLTVEEGTALSYLVKTKKTSIAPDEHFAEQFNILLSMMKEYGYEQYEISNFCKPGMYSKHNTNYWLYEPYLGLGPSAHSYNGKNRHVNIANNAGYIKSLKNNSLPISTEELNDESRFNEYILVALRTKWGINITRLQEMFPEFYKDFFRKVEKYLKEGLMKERQNELYLSDKGKLLADSIASDLFIDR